MDGHRQFVGRRSRLVICAAAVAGLGLSACALEEEASSDAARARLFAPGAALARQPLPFQETAYIDIRGVGDSGWAGNQTQVPLAARFGEALDDFDPTGDGYQADLAFLNWESVVGTRCSQFSPERFGFLSHPDNLVQASDRGYNLIGLSNNHTRDCHDGRGERASAEMTINAMATAMRDRPVIWHGVAPSSMDKTQPKVKSFTIKDRTVRVAFNSIHLGRESCPDANCNEDRYWVLQNLRDADADLRILAIHVLEFGDAWQRIAEVGAEFIRNYQGDVVYGHGPHVWKPVHVVERNDGSGRKGVVFTSVGNFIHPGLSAQARNAIGRALLDPETLALRQIQVLTVATAGGSASYGSTPAAQIGAYGNTSIPWQDFTERSTGVAIRGAFVNLE
jgi:poly-gamma-glutamate synthesis protein (capsule biosynthesis protein)